MNIFSTLLLVAVIFLIGCSSSRKPFYFRWQPAKHSEETENFKPANIVELKSQSMKYPHASILRVPIDFYADPIDQKTKLNKVELSKEIKEIKHGKHNVVNPVSGNDTTRTRNGVTFNDPKKNKSAKLGFWFSIAGFLTALGAPIFLSTWFLLFAFFLFLPGFILSLIGMKSEKRKLAIAGTIISGIFMGLALLGVIARFLSAG